MQLNRIAKFCFGWLETKSRETSAVQTEAYQQVLY